MYFNAPRLQQRVPIKKIFLGEHAPKPPLASSRLRRSIGKFQFLLAKPNPMPDYGETRGPLFLLFQMVFAKVEYYLLNYSLFIWTISLSY